MADPLVLTVLAYGHVLSAFGWLGGGLLTVFVISPGLQKLSAPSRLEFIAKVIPRLLRYTTGMIVGTFLFGLLLLYAITNGDFSLISPSTTFGAAISAGISLALVAAIVALGVTFPSFRKMVTISEGLLKNGQQPPPPEMAKYAGRARVGALVGSVLLLIVLAMMITAGFF